MRFAAEFPPVERLTLRPIPDNVDGSERTLPVSPPPPPPAPDFRPDGNGRRGHPHSIRSIPNPARGPARLRVVVRLGPDRHGGFGVGQIAGQGAREVSLRSSDFHRRIGGLAGGPNRPAPALLDVRTEAEFAVSHLPGALRIDPDASPAQVVAAIRPNTAVVVYCSVGYRSSQLAKRLQKAGVAGVSNLDGSIFQWANEGRLLHKAGEPAKVVASLQQDFRQGAEGGIPGEGATGEGLAMEPALPALNQWRSLGALGLLALLLAWKSLVHALADASGDLLVESAATPGIRRGRREAGGPRCARSRPSHARRASRFARASAR